MYDMRDVIVNGESLCVNETAHCRTRRAIISGWCPRQDARGRQGLLAATSVSKAEARRRIILAASGCGLRLARREGYCLYMDTAGMI